MCGISSFHFFGGTGWGEDVMGGSGFEGEGERKGKTLLYIGKYITYGSNIWVWFPLWSSLLFFHDGLFSGSGVRSSFSPNPKISCDRHRDLDTAHGEFSSSEEKVFQFRYLSNARFVKIS